MIVKPDAQNLMANVRAAAKKGPPPVHLWDPPFCGDLDMRIARDGTWFYNGTPIGRDSMVRLFSSILKREGDAYFLVTPVEKVGIQVEDAPFVAVDVDARGEGQAQVLTFTTHVGDRVEAGPEHPIRVTFREGDEPAPYITVRNRLEALIHRKDFMRLIDLCTSEPVDGIDWFGVWSNGMFFRIIEAREIEQQ